MLRVPCPSLILGQGSLDKLKANYNELCPSVNDAHTEEDPSVNDADRLKDDAPKEKDLGKEPGEMKKKGQIRIGPEFWFNPVYESKGISLPVPPDGLRGVVDDGFGSVDDLVASLLNRLQTAIKDIADFVANDGDIVHPVDPSICQDIESEIESVILGQVTPEFQKLEAQLGSNVESVIIGAFGIGRYRGYEEGKLLLRQLYGAMPRATKLHSYETSRSIGTSVPEFGVDYRTFYIEVETRMERNRSFDEYLFSLSTHMESLTGYVFKLVAQRSRDSCFPIKLFPPVGLIDDRMVDVFHQTKETLANRELEDRELLDKIEGLTSETLFLARKIGYNVGFQHGQDSMNREYGFQQVHLSLELKHPLCTVCPFYLSYSYPYAVIQMLLHDGTVARYQRMEGKPHSKWNSSLPGSKFLPLYVTLDGTIRQGTTRAFLPN